MNLLALFEFFNIQNYTGDTGSKWVEITATAVLSGGVAWLAAFIQNDNQKKLVSDEKHEKWDLIRLAYLTSLDTAINDMKTYLGLVLPQIKKLENIDHEFTLVKPRSSGAMSVLNMNYNEIHSSFTFISKNDISILQSFVRSYEAVYMFSVDLEELNSSSKRYLLAVSKIKDEISENMSEVSTSIKNLLLDNRIDKSISSSIHADFSKFFIQPQEKINLSGFKITVENVFDKYGQIHLINNDNLKSFVILLKIIGRNFVRIDNELSVYIKALESIRDNLRMGIGVSNDFTDLFKNTPNNQ